MNHTPIPHEFLEEMEELSDEEFGRLIRWGLTYHITGNMSELLGNEKFFAKRVKMQIDRFADAYKDKCDKASASAHKRWNANACERMPTDANAQNAMRTDANDAKPKPKPNPKPIGNPVYNNNPLSTNESTSSKESVYMGRFTPPTLADVQAYCAERKNGISAEHFIDYHQRQGWKLSNGQPMKDWKAAVRTWEQKRKQKPPGYRESTLDRARRLEMEGAFDD